MPDRTVLRWGSWAAIFGGILALAVNILHPRPETFGDPVAEEIRMIGTSDSWVAIHLGILAASLLIAFGLFAVSRSLKGGPAEGIARIALGSLLISTPIAVMTFLLDGYASKAAADAVTADASQIGAATAVVSIGWAAFMGTVITFLGITPALFGWAAARSGTYPAWMGWGAVIFGIGSVAAGVWGILDGASQGFFLVFSVCSGILTLFVIALGIFLGRQVSGPITVPEGKTSRTSARTG